jgi:hypothetical protein
MNFHLLSYKLPFFNNKGRKEIEIERKTGRKERKKENGSKEA